MKNMSVGKKILTGFLAVILMIALILGLTVVTSLTRNNDLARVNHLSDLQREANLMLQDFLLARVEIRTLFTSIDTGDEYALAKEYLAAAEARLARMREQSAALDGYMAQDMDTLDAMFDGVNAGVDEVYNMDLQTNQALATMTENGAIMTESSALLFDLVLSLTRQLSEGDAEAGYARLFSVILPAKDVGDAVNEIRVASRAVMYDQDLSALPGLAVLMDELDQKAAALRANLTTDEARAATDAVTAAADGFHNAILSVEDILTRQTADIDDARTTFLALNDLVVANVDAIAADMNSLNEATMATSLTIMFIMIAVGVFAVVFSVAVAVFLGRSITRPLNKMKDVMLQAGATGNLAFSEEVKAGIEKEAQAKDEIGQSLKAFSALIQHITNMAGQLQQVADKDLTIDIALLSDGDTMGNALKTMVDTLNYMFSEINAISSQVATAAGEVAMGAQSLAQGSTEQASTVQEISASINEINQQMSTSNDTAGQAAREAQEINRVAGEGNDKMSHLSGSMQQINDASQAIGQVIKVIDDIAFQTNILALNAAVEAARAGEHGKGFAVVADEVRNLAGKSADAAKETAQLISANIEKTEQGMAYTTETAESLGQIMQGIGKTNDSLQLVAEQAEGAQAATAQVTLAVDQVAQVVQQNSATSEESAAAAQQMSSQAQVLQQLIAQFKLKGAPQDAPGLPGGHTPGQDPTGPEAPPRAADIIF